MLIEPGVEVNAVVDGAAPEADRPHAELKKQRDTNPEILGGLTLRQAPTQRQRQMRSIVVTRRHRIAAAKAQFRL